MKAPVAIFAYRRLDHLKHTLTSLERNSQFEDTDIYIFADNARGSKDQADVQAVRNFLQEYVSQENHSNVKIYLAQENKGLSKSIIEGVTQIINEYGKIIVLEDDLETTSDFLSYMNDALDFYQADQRIWSIAGYSPNLSCLDQYPHDVYLGFRASSWGWATWSDRWQGIDWEVKDFDKLQKSRNLQKKLNRGGPDMYKMLKLQMKGKINSWAIRWCYQQSKEDKLTIFPKISKIKNLGLDGSGEHCDSNDKFAVRLKEAPYRLENVELDDSLVKAYYDLFVPGLKEHLGHLKRIGKDVLRKLG